MYFKDIGPNMKANPLPKHGGGGTMNMVSGCPGEFRIFDINMIRGNLLKMHALICQYSHYEHDHKACRVCREITRDCYVVEDDLQEMLGQGLIHIKRC